jgi:hypothetical protein
LFFGETCIKGGEEKRFRVEKGERVLDLYSARQHLNEKLFPESFCKGKSMDPFGD